MKYIDTNKMQILNEYPIIVITLLFIVIYSLLNTNTENFSTSGLAISDRYCTQLADVYHQPRVTDIDARNNYRKKICGKSRRNTVDFSTGNYLTHNGVFM